MIDNWRCPVCEVLNPENHRECSECGYQPKDYSGLPVEVQQSKEEQVFFEVRTGTRYYTWRSGRIELKPLAQVITIYGHSGEENNFLKEPGQEDTVTIHADGSFTITVRINEIANCEIIETEDVTPFSHSFRPVSYAKTAGCALLIIMPLMIIEDIIAKKTATSAIKLTLSTSDNSEQNWMVHLHSKKNGQRGQVSTMEMAGQIVTFLRQNGYSGPAPNLDDIAKTLSF